MPGRTAGCRSGQPACHDQPGNPISRVAWLPDEMHTRPKREIVLYAALAGRLEGRAQVIKRSSS